MFLVIACSLLHLYAAYNPFYSWGLIVTDRQTDRFCGSIRVVGVVPSWLPKQQDWASAANTGRDNATTLEAYS